MPFPFHSTRRVEFCHTDAAGIMHFSVFFQFMEQVEHEMLRGHGLSVFTEVDGQKISWPRVSARCDYTNPVRFEDEVTIGCGVDEISEKTVTFGFDFVANRLEVATGSIIAACCAFDDAGPSAIAIPPEIRRRLEALMIG